MSPTKERGRSTKPFPGSKLWRGLLTNMLQQCDLTRPGCNRCKAAGLTCEGYTIERHFVNGGVKGDNQAPANSRQMTPSQEKRPWLGRYTTRADISKCKDSNIVSSDSLVRTARQQLYLGHLWTTMLPKGGHFSSETWRLSAPGWAGLVSMLYDTEPSLKYVTFAMALGCLATQCNDNQMRLKSLQTYNTAVQELSTALQQRDAHKRDGLIVAAGLMASFEVCLFAAATIHGSLSVFCSLSLFQLMNRESWLGNTTPTGSKAFSSTEVQWHSPRGQPINYLWIAASTWYLAHYSPSACI